MISCLTSNTMLDQGLPVMTLGGWGVQGGWDGPAGAAAGSARPLLSRFKEPMDYDMPDCSDLFWLTQLPQYDWTLDHPPPSMHAMLIDQEHSNPLISLPSEDCDMEIISIGSFGSNIPTSRGRNKRKKKTPTNQRM